MKRFILLIFAAIAFMSCENIEDNSPAMQGDIDDLFFKAADARAEKNDDGTYTLQGTNSDEILTLHIDDADLGSYPLGAGYPNFINYEDGNGNLYQSSPNGDGSIELTDRCLSCGWLTGTFNSTLILPNIDTLTVERGIFFQVSFLEGGLVGNTGSGNEGMMEATIDGVYFNAATMDVEISGNSIIITGTLNNRSIRLIVPASTTQGTYPISTPGYSASYIEGINTEVAESGTIRVNFINSVSTRILFNFTTDNHNITLGNTRAFF